MKALFGQGLGLKHVKAINVRNKALERMTARERKNKRPVPVGIELDSDTSIRIGPIPTRSQNPKPFGGTIKYWVIDPPHPQAYGLVYGDTRPRFRDGERIVTSKILKITIETRNSIYELDPETYGA